MARLRSIKREKVGGTSRQVKSVGSSMSPLAIEDNRRGSTGSVKCSPELLFQYAACERKNPIGVIPRLKSIDIVPSDPSSPKTKTSIAPESIEEVQEEVEVEVEVEQEDAHTGEINVEEDEHSDENNVCFPSVFLSALAY